MVKRYLSRSSKKVCCSGWRSYLGCTASTRKPRAGEDWDRGNDLPDGPFNRRTWIKILNGIVKYELVLLAPPINYQADTPEVGPSLEDENSDDLSEDVALASP